MIWRLMKLDPVWVWTAMLSFASLFFCALGGSFVVAALLLFSCGVMATQSTNAAFYMALPVTSRQVYLERTLSVNVLLWLPLAIGGQMFMLVSHGDTPGGSVIAIGSVLMLVLQAIQAAKFRRRNAPGWLMVVPFAVWLASSTVPGLPELIVPWQSWLLRQASRTAAPVASICWLLTATLFAWEFALADSFVLRPAELNAPRIAARATHPMRGPLARLSYMIPIFISFSYLWVVYFVFAVVMGLRMSNDMTSVFIFISVLSVWDGIGRKFRWMSCLPISPRALLAGILLPALAAIGAGYEIGLRIPVARLPLLRDLARITGASTLPGFRDQVASVIVLAAGLMTMTLWLMANNWRNSGGRLALRFYVIVPSALLLADGRKVAGSLPANLPALIAVGVISLGLLYWALDAAFRQLEFIDKPAAGEGA